MEIEIRSKERRHRRTRKGGKGGEEEEEGEKEENENGRCELSEHEPKKRWKNVRRK